MFGGAARAFVLEFRHRTGMLKRQRDGSKRVRLGHGSDASGGGTMDSKDADNERDHLRG